MRCVSKNSSQAKRYLAKRGCTFVRRAGRMSVLPQHGGAKELGTGLWRKFLKDLDIKDEG